MSNIHDAANRGATKIKIMYIAFLSYSQLKEYLPVLIENNLIEYHNGTQTFRTTKKGLKFLKTYDEWKNYYKLQQSKIAINLIFWDTKSEVLTAERDDSSYTVLDVIYLFLY